MKLGEAIEDVEAAETSLANELLKIAERHAAEQDVYHVCHTLAKRCDEQLALLTPHRKRYGAHVSQRVGEPAAGVERVRRMSSELLAGQQPSGALLLRDLKELAGVVQHAELEWVVLLQAAKAARDQQLKTAAEEGREHAEARGKWVRTRIQELAPQVLLAG